MSGDFRWRHGDGTFFAMIKLMDALDTLYDEGWRVHNQDAFRITNGVTDLELWHDTETGWYFDEEEA